MPRQLEIDYYKLFTQALFEDRKVYKGRFAQALERASAVTQDFLFDRDKVEGALGETLFESANRPPLGPFLRAVNDLASCTPELLSALHENLLTYVISVRSLELVPPAQPCVQRDFSGRAAYLFQLADAVACADHRSEDPRTYNGDAPHETRAIVDLVLGSMKRPFAGLDGSTQRELARVAAQEMKIRDASVFQTPLDNRVLDLITAPKLPPWHPSITSAAQGTTHG